MTTVTAPWTTFLMRFSPTREPWRFSDWTATTSETCPGSQHSQSPIISDCKYLTRPLFHCHGLKDLSLADNELGNVPTAVSSLATLVRLDVSKNVLIDLPETIKQCKHLAVIQASVNPLQKIPEGCTQLISLTELYLNDCLLEYIPANFGRLAKLKILELRENSLKSLPKSMERLVSMTRIDLSQNQFTEVWSCSLPLST